LKCWEPGAIKWKPGVYVSFGSRPCALLFAMGIDPNSMLYWILLLVSETVKEDPVSTMTELRCRLYPIIGEQLGLSEAAVEAHIRRAAGMYKNGKFKLMREYMPAGVVRPTASEFLGAWLRMCTLCENDEKKP